MSSLSLIAVMPTATSTVSGGASTSTSAVTPTGTGEPESEGMTSVYGCCILLCVASEVCKINNNMA